MYLLATAKQGIETLALVCLVVYVFVCYWHLGDRNVNISVCVVDRDVNISVCGR